MNWSIIEEGVKLVQDVALSAPPNPNTFLLLSPMGSSVDPLGPENLKPPSLVLPPWHPAHLQSAPMPSFPM